MARRPPLPSLPAPLRQRREQRSRRLLATRVVRDRVVSLAGLVGAPIQNQAGAEVGTIVDFVAKWDGGEPYPPVVGMVARVGRRRTWVPGDQVADLTESGAKLRTSRLDLRDYERRHGEEHPVRVWDRGEVESLAS